MPTLADDAYQLNNLEACGITRQDAYNIIQKAETKGKAPIVYNYLKTFSCGSNVIAIQEASYGVNVNDNLRGNRTSLFKSLADGKDRFDYTFHFGDTGGDPAPNKFKTLEIKYTCGSGPVNTMTVPAGAGLGDKINISCYTGSCWMHPPSQL